MKDSKKFAKKMTKAFYIIAVIMALYTLYMIIMTFVSINQTATQYGVTALEVIKQSLPNIFGQNFPNIVDTLIIFGIGSIFRFHGLGGEEEEDFVKRVGSSDGTSKIEEEVCTELTDIIEDPSVHEKVVEIMEEKNMDIDNKPLENKKEDETLESDPQEQDV